MLCLRTPAACALTAALLAGCGSSSSDGASTPAQFSARTAQACKSVQPRLKSTSSQITTLDQSKGNPLDKLPQLAGLIGDLDKEFSDLHTDMAKIKPPKEQQPAYNVFLADLTKLEGLTKQATAQLKPGTIAGLRQFKALGPSLDAATTGLSRDAAAVPGLKACNNIG